VASIKSEKKRETLSATGGPGSRLKNGYTEAQ
jgi:hypothetical protein